MESLVPLYEGLEGLESTCKENGYQIASINWTFLSTSKFIITILTQ
jgi:hypothetical protein